VIIDPTEENSQKSLETSACRGVCVALVVSALVGCATVDETIQERPKTVAGAAAGTAGGALIGGLVFKSATGAVVGGLLGGLAGGLVGNALESKAQDYPGTAQDYNYTSAQGTVVRIEGTDVEPSRVQQGKRVNLMTQYALLMPDPNEEVTVTERWEVTRNGQLVSNPVHTVQRQAGTWASIVPMTLPATARAGEYRVAVTVEAAGAYDREATAFTVR
jgi:uncharacterized protein YcfJ